MKDYEALQTELETVPMFYSVADGTESGLWLLSYLYLFEGFWDLYRHNGRLTIPKYKSFIQDANEKPEMVN
jgi:hypothetical protein